MNSFYYKAPLHTLTLYLKVNSDCNSECKCAGTSDWYSPLQKNRKVSNYLQRPSPLCQLQQPVTILKEALQAQADPWSSLVVER